MALDVISGQIQNGGCGGDAGKVKIHPYIMTLLKWCISRLWTATALLLERLKYPRLAIKSSPKAIVPKLPASRGPSKQHLHPDPLVHCEVLHEPKDQPEVDFVFVHGLYGSLENTWKQGEWMTKYKNGLNRVPLKRPSSIPPCKKAKTNCICKNSDAKKNICELCKNTYFDDDVQSNDQNVGNEKNNVQSQIKVEHKFKDVDIKNIFNCKCKTNKNTHVTNENNQEIEINLDSVNIGNGNHDINRNTCHTHVRNLDKSYQNNKTNEGIETETLNNQNYEIYEKLINSNEHYDHDEKLQEERINNKNIISKTQINDNHDVQDYLRALFQENSQFIKNVIQNVRHDIHLADQYNKMSNVKEKYDKNIEVNDELLKNVTFKSEDVADYINMNEDNTNRKQKNNEHNLKRHSEDIPETNIVPTICTNTSLGCKKIKLDVQDKDFIQTRSESTDLPVPSPKSSTKRPDATKPSPKTTAKSPEFRSPIAKCEKGCGCTCDDCYSFCWPKDWLSVDFPNCRVISVNYTSDPYLWRPLWVKPCKRLRLQERAEQMTSQLLSLGVGKRPVVWVGHSKGGLFIKQIYTEAFESFTRINSGHKNINEETTVKMEYESKITVDRRFDTTDIIKRDCKDSLLEEFNTKDNLNGLRANYGETKDNNEISIDKNDVTNKMSLEQTKDNMISSNIISNAETRIKDKHDSKSNEIKSIDSNIDRDRRIDNKEYNFNDTSEAIYKFRGEKKDTDNTKTNENSIDITDEHKASLWLNSAAFMFYSVPHRGSPLANIKTPLTARSIELLEISKDCSLVLSLQDRWLKAIENRKPLVRSLVETNRTLMSILWLRIVSAESADAGTGALCGISVDHREICKPSSRNCVLYTELLKLVHAGLDKWKLNK